MLNFLKTLFKSKNNQGTHACALSLSATEHATLKSVDPKIVIGKIHKIEAHSDPKVTKVRVTQTEIFPGKMVQILCGGQNIREGQIVPVATVGAKLSPDFEIGARAIRGVESHGMICARDELGLEKENDGIWELPTALESKIGTPMNAL
jgi:phenylalanyl-tRNA synthetase beta chain